MPTTISLAREQRFRSCIFSATAQHQRRATRNPIDNHKKQTKPRHTSPAIMAKKQGKASSISTPAGASPDDLLPSVDERSALLIESDAVESEDETHCANNETTAVRSKRKFISSFNLPAHWKVIVGVLAAITLQVLLVMTIRGGRRGSQTSGEAYFHDNVSDNNNKNPIGNHPSTRSKYKKVQGMGFQIYTGAAPAYINVTTTDNDGNEDGFSLEKNPECLGHYSYGQLVGELAPHLQCYLGHDDPIKDIRKRIRIMEKAVDRAFELSDKNPETLKVFVAPEFYWRGINGAYMFRDEEANDPLFCGPICLLLKGLEDIVAQKRFEDWLFLFGTVIASETLPTEDPYDYLFYNFAPIYKGYDPADMDHTGKRFLSPKRYVSSSDFLTPARHLNASIAKELVGEDLPEHDDTVFNPHDFDRKRYDYDVWDNYREELNGLGYAMIEYGWLMVDGLALSVEICFDHQMHTSLNTYLADITTGRRTLIPSSSDQGLDYVHIPEYQAQISIVSSAGMTVVPESLVLTNNGTIFLQDGLSNDTNVMYWGMDGCELGLQFDGGTEAVQRRAFISATDIFFEHTALDTFRREDIFHGDWVRSIHGYFSTEVYKPQMTIFEPVAIANVEVSQ